MTGIAHAQGSPRGQGVPPAPRLAVLVPYVLVSFAANSLITRYVVVGGLLEAGLLSGIRFMAGALALVAWTALRRRPVRVGRANVLPAVWLGCYAVAISYGYRFIGAAAGTLVFYATVLLTLIGHDLVRKVPVTRRRGLGALVALAGVTTLSAGSRPPADAVVSAPPVTPIGIALLMATGLAWGLYTIAGRGVADAQDASTGNFVIVAGVAAAPTAVGVTVGLPVTASGVALAVLMGVGTTALAYVAWYACQRTLSGSAAGLIQLAIPVITGFGAVLLLHELLSVELAMGAALVGTGLYLGAQPSSRRA